MDIKSDRVLREIAAIAFAQTTDAVEVTGSGEVKVTPTALLSYDQRAAIAEIAKTKDGIRVKMHDKMPALQLLAKYLHIDGANEEEGKVSIQQLIMVMQQQAQARVSGGAQAALAGGIAVLPESDIVDCARIDEQDEVRPETPEIEQSEETT
jgi:hypothetical protein